MSNERNNNNGKGFLSWENILKFLGIVIPVCSVLIAGYINIMIKLTELEQNIKFGVERYVKVEKELEELKQKVDNNFSYMEKTYYKREDEYYNPPKKKNQ